MLFQNLAAALLSPKFFDELQEWALREGVGCDVVRSSGSRVVPSISPVNNPTFPISFPFPLFPSFPLPCSLQIKEHRVPKDVKDLFLSLSFQDPTPILAGFCLHQSKDISKSAA